MLLLCLAHNEHSITDGFPIVVIIIIYFSLGFRTLGPVLFELPHCTAPEAGYTHASSSF